MTEPVTMAVPIEELRRAKDTLEEALYPKVPFTGNLEDMRAEAADLQKAAIMSLISWINTYEQR